ncbi:MAG: ThiF family adenylyltransferase [Theionarchaea archaeon]|nr:ThiF family adenylyltransferase [Theionarchaea archaeon]
MPYDDLFTRNVGILSLEELYTLKMSTVALAGVGGVGGIQLITLARTGVGAFHIADPECFQMSDINRQYGASLSTVERKKVDVLTDLVTDINPEAHVNSYSTGITEENIEAFLDKADIVIDSIEYFALDMKVALAQKARERGLFLVTSPTWGYGASLIVFSPQGMTFETFFGIDLCGQEDFFTKGKRYADRLFPLKPLYLQPYPYGDDMLEGKQPASVLCLGTLLSAALVTTEVISLLLQNREPITAPRVIQLDLFRRSIDITDLSEKT